MGVEQVCGYVCVKITLRGAAGRGVGGGGGCGREGVSGEREGATHVRGGEGDSGVSVGGEEGAREGVCQ